MKKLLPIALAVLMICIACAPAAQGAAQNLDAVTPTPQVEEEAPAVGLPNPITEFGTLEDMLKAANGINMKQPPEGSTDIVYSTITGAEVSPIAQIQFNYEGNDYCYRGALCKSEADMQDIAGVYDEFASQQDVVTDPNLTFGGSYSLQCNAGSTLGLATWYYALTGCQYSLFTTTGCGDDQKIEEVVDQLLPITTDLSGTPFALPQTTLEPEATKVVDAVEGIVVSLSNNEIVINTSNGNTLTFLLSNIVSVDAVNGDKVKIEYAGNILEAPEAVTVTVTEKIGTVISGSIVQHDKQAIYVKTATGNIYGFVLTDKTVISGADTKITTDASVKVIYTGELVEQPVAASVEIVTPGKDKPADDPLVNKTLDGNVSKLSSKWVYIYTNAGHSYKFARVDSTRYTGNYTLELGAKIKVTYDGYASNSPDAKIIKVLAPPDPTPPEPTTHKVTGTIVAKAGNMLAIETDGGEDYSFLFGSVKISGDSDCDVGDRATVTFYYNDDGSMHATAVRYTKTIYYEPGPVIDPDPDPDPIPFLLGSGPVIGE